MTCLLLPILGHHLKGETILFAPELMKERIGTYTVRQKGPVEVGCNATFPPKLSYSNNRLEAFIFPVK